MKNGNEERRNERRRGGLATVEEVDALERLCEWMAMSILYTCICMWMLIVPFIRSPLS